MKNVTNGGRCTLQLQSNALLVQRGSARRVGLPKTPHERGELLRRQRRRERHGDYNAYELVDGSWCEIESRLARRNAWTSPPFFII